MAGNDTGTPEYVLQIRDELAQVREQLSEMWAKRYGEPTADYHQPDPIQEIQYEQETAELRSTEERLMTELRSQAFIIGVS